MKLLRAISIFCLSAVLTTQSASAAVLFADDFSEGATHWRALRDSGSMWTSHQGYVEAYVPSRSTVTELAPVFWPENIEQSFIYRLTFTPLQGADRNISFAFKDLDNSYQIHFAQGVTELSKFVNNSRVWVHQSPYNLINGIEYRAEITFDAGTISLKLNDVDILSGSDPTYDGETGIVTLRVTTGAAFPTKIRFSDVSVSTLSNDEETVDQGTRLAIQELKQTDARWKDLEYDTASAWTSASNASFADWACNLVSQVMILQFHGITSLPDGSPLNPISYNQWLLESSGYWQSPKTGNITRTSVSKLALLMHRIKQSTKLEFAYTPNPSIAAIVEEINQGRPAILELDGHFVVAYGFTPEKDDIYISDPAYAVERLSQHPLALKSMRSYIPSQTDLRYLEIHADPAVQFALELDGKTVGTDSTEYIRRFSPESAEYSPARRIFSLAKPGEGNYRLKVSNPTAEKQRVQIVSVDADSASSIQEMVAQSNSTVQMEITYAADAVTIEPVSEDDSRPDSDATDPNLNENVWQTFRQRVLALSSSREIKRHNITSVLLKLTSVVEKSPSAYIENVMKRMMSITLSSLPTSAITDKARSELLEILDQLV